MIIIIMMIKIIFSQPEPEAREEQPIYLTLTLHRKVRKPESK